MRIGELSRQSGIPVATIKYYVREGLVPAGERTNFNQTDYGDVHLRRLRLIKVLTGYGRLSLAEVGELLTRVQDAQEVSDALLALRTVRATHPTDDVPAEATDWANGIVERIIPDDKYMQRVQGAGDLFRRALEAFPEEYRPQVERYLDRYNMVCRELANIDMELSEGLLGEDKSQERMVLVSLTGMMLRGELSDALTSVYHERIIMDRYWSDEDFARLKEKYS